GVANKRLCRLVRGLGELTLERSPKSLGVRRWAAVVQGGQAPAIQGRCRRRMDGGGRGSWCGVIERRQRKDGATTYRVRYRTPDGRFRSRAFRRRGDAVAYEREMEAQKRRGDWVDPQRGRITLAMVWEEYERAGMTHLRVTTQNGYRYAWKHIEPTFGRWPVAKIEHADVADWVSELSRSVGTDTVRRVHGVLCRILDHACRTRRVPVNVARGVRLPKRAPARERILTVAQVHALADA